MSIKTTPTPSIHTPAHSPAPSTSEVLKAVFEHTDKHSHEIYQLADLLELVTFAVEARRVLNAIDDVCEHCPETEQRLKTRIECPNTWREMTDNTGQILWEASTRLRELGHASLNHETELATRYRGGADHEG